MEDQQDGGSDINVFEKSFACKTTSSPQKSHHVMTLNSKDHQKNEHETIRGLIKEIDYKNHKLLELEQRCDETNAYFRKVIVGLTNGIISKENNIMAMQQKYNETFVTNMRLEKEQVILKKYYNREWNNKQSINRRLEHIVISQKKELEWRAKELEESKIVNGLVLKALKSENEMLKEKLLDQNVVESNNNSNTEMSALKKEIEEKTEEIQDLQTLNHILVARDFKSNQELHECRKALIDGLQDMLNNRTKLVIKRMGEVDQCPFQEICFQRKIPGEDWQGQAARICSCWQEKVKDPLWHPFKIDVRNGIAREIINENDEKLKALRAEFGEPTYEAVTNALLEMNEYNPSGCYAVPEIWNIKESRKASLKEVVQYILHQLKTRKKKRKRI